jgi:hypothetical protein
MKRYFKIGGFIAIIITILFAFIAPNATGSLSEYILPIYFAGAVISGMLPFYLGFLLILFVAYCIGGVFGLLFGYLKSGITKK